MFLQSEKDIDQEREQNASSLAVRCFKPKLITSLNYEQQYLIRRKQKRNNRGHKEKSKFVSQQTSEINNQQLNENNSEDAHESEIQNNFYKEVYDGNDKISGYWVNGLLDGQAEIEYQNGDFFKGKFEKGYKVEGLMVFKEQSSYEGAFYNQQFHGKGVLRLKQKTISAQWNNGIVEGSCVVEYKNGNVYYGPLKDFKKHGYGYLYFPTDSKFFGQFIQGMIKGYGEYFEKGKLKCKGLWKNGKLIQQKKEEDWSYNFQEENIDWNIIEELFEKKGTGVASCFEMLIVNQQTQPEDDLKFKEMLETIKRSHMSANKQQETGNSVSSSEGLDSQVEKIEDNKPSSMLDLFGFLKL